MTLTELKKYVDHAIEERPYSGDIDVVIPNSKPSIGGISCTHVKYASTGIDWDSGKFILTPETSLIEKPKKYESVNEQIRKNRDDAYHQAQKSAKTMFNLHIKKLLSNNDKILKLATAYVKEAMGPNYDPNSIETESKMEMFIRGYLYSLHELQSYTES